MQQTPFSPMAAIEFGWNTFKKEKKFWIIGALLMFMIGGSGNINVGNTFNNESDKTEVQDSQIPPFNDLVNPEVNSMTPQKEQVNGADTNIPFVPQTVDNVLGISDKRDSGEYVAFMVLLVLVVLVFSIPFLIASMLISGSIQMGVVKFYLTAVRGKKPQYETILSEVKLQKALRFLAVSFLYVLLVFFGLLLFIVPGIYFAVKYTFAAYNVVDKDTGIGESFSLSAKATQGNKWNLIGLGFLIMFANIAGILALFYGLLVSVPVTMLATAYAYNKLSKSTS